MGKEKSPGAFPSGLKYDRLQNTHSSKGRIAKFVSSTSDGASM